MKLKNIWATSMVKKEKDLVFHLKKLGDCVLNNGGMMFLMDHVLLFIHQEIILKESVKMVRRMAMED